MKPEGLSKKSKLEPRHPLRVCVVSPLYHPSLGGLGRQAMLLTERLAEEGVRIFVIARRMKGMPPAVFNPRVKIYRAWSVKPYLHNFEKLSIVNLLTTLTFALSCACLLFRHRKKYEIVHFHGASLPLLVNLPVAKLLRKKVIAKIAAAKLGTEAGALRGKYFGLGNAMAGVLHGIDGLVATTGEIEQGLLHDGFAAEKIKRISNFIDFASFSPPEPDQIIGMKEKAGFGQNRIVVFSGRFIERKGIPFLLQAWQSLYNDFPDARLVFLGDGPLLADMRRMAGELGIENSVQFRGHVPRVKNLLQAADIFVFPSLQEGMPNSLLEAMACGLPPVATRIGGVEDIIVDGENGILIEPADVASLAAGLRRLLADEKLASTMASRASQTIQDHYSLDGTIPKYLALYRSLLERRPDHRQ